MEGFRVWETWPMADLHSEDTEALPRVEAIDRALVLLNALATIGAAGVSLGGLCASTGISKATAYRALSTMRARGFVSQGPDGNYSLGPQALQLSKQYLGPHNLASRVEPGLVVALSRSTENWSTWACGMGATSSTSTKWSQPPAPSASGRQWGSVSPRRRVPSAGLCSEPATCTMGHWRTTSTACRPTGR